MALIYSTLNKYDRQGAALLHEAMAIRTVELIDRNRHNSLLDCLRAGVLSDVVAWLVGVRT
ncbi:MAG: hypothetical protein CMM46_13005 [Rhodospirillaceae bacterium]|nr:hypothetical protein [Rhodospirillaceae bacterium]|tara:strand:+ start:18257 stop:18439 length:183 start_codon:yes stop_codon:yes gene_type:complete